MHGNRATLTCLAMARHTGAAGALQVVSGLATFTSNGQKHPSILVFGVALLPLYKVPYIVDAANAAGGGAGAEGTSLSAFAQAVLTQSINCSGVAG